jgi:hypothetical protein
MADKSLHPGPCRPFRAHRILCWREPANSALHFPRFPFCRVRAAALPKHAGAPHNSFEHVEQISGTFSSSQGMMRQNRSVHGKTRMPAGQLHQVLQHVRTLPGAQSARDANDRSLIARFAWDCDLDAFAELVRRHGKLVWGLCRRLRAMSKRLWFDQEKRLIHPGPPAPTMAGYLIDVKTKKATPLKEYALVNGFCTPTKENAEVKGSDRAPASQALATALSAKAPDHKAEAESQALSGRRDDHPERQIHPLPH